MARLSIISVLVAGSFIIATGARAADIPWPTNILYEKAANQEDVKRVLNGVAQQAGLGINFGPGVDKDVSFNIVNVPLGAAFNQIIDIAGLGYRYDATTRTITILATGPRTQEVLLLEHATPKQITDAVSPGRLGMGGEIRGDEKNGIVMLKGTADEVKQLRDLVEKLDKAEGKRQDALRGRLTADATRAAEEAKRTEAEASAQTKKLELEREQRIRDEVLGTDVKIFAVKYANVGKTTQTFQGQSITLPGIDETLRAMLGLTSEKGGEKGTGQDSVDDKRLFSQLQRQYGRMPPVITIDERTNSVIVRGTPTAIAEVERALKKLDTKVPLIEIEVMIVAADKTVAEELGIRWGGNQISSANSKNAMGSAFETGNNAAIGGTPASSQMTPYLAGGTTTQTTATALGNVTTSAATAAAAINPVSLLPAAAGLGMSYVYRGPHAVLEAQLAAMSSAQKTQTISAPRVITLNNLEAKITNDRTLYIPTLPGANTAGTYEQVKAGLVLRITPSLINRMDTGEDSLVRLNINASNKDIQAGGNNTYGLAGNEVQTQVVIPDGSTFIMGGLTNDSRREGKDGVPLLQDIPILGGLFSSRTSQQNLDETLFFITPKLVHPDDIYAQDIAQRNYLLDQREKMREMRRDIQGQSQLLRLNPGTLAEDE